MSLDIIQSVSCSTQDICWNRLICRVIISGQTQTRLFRGQIRPSNVVNIANSTKEGERTYGTLLKACQGFLKISPPLLGIIRRDAKVRETIRNQTPLLTRYPNCEAAIDVETIVRRLLA